MVAQDPGGHDPGRQIDDPGVQDGSSLTLSGPTVSAGYAKALFDLAVTRGAAPAALAARAGFDTNTCGNPDDRVACATFEALMRAAIVECQDPAFALHFGAESHFNEISIVGLITHAAATMGEAFAQMNRFARLAIEVDGHESGDRFAIVRRDNELWIEDRRRNPDAFPELTESTFARFVSHTARFFGDAPFAKAICFTHPEPAHSAEHARIFKVPITFGSDRNAIAIHESWLSIPLPYPDRYVFGIFTDRAEALLDDLVRNTSLRGQVEAAILPHLHTGDPGMAHIARKLGTSRTSLYRRLKAEATSYDEILDALRHHMALDYLASRKLAVNEVAYLVGFSDPAAFSRAFKRWTGTSPGSLRRHGAG